MQRSLHFLLTAQLSTGCCKLREVVLAALSQKSDGFCWRLSHKGTVQLLGQSYCAGCERRALPQGFVLHRDGSGLVVWLTVRVWVVSPCVPLWAWGVPSSVTAGDIFQPAWLCSTSLHMLCPDLAQVTLPVTCPVSWLCWSTIPAWKAVVCGAHVWGLTQSCGGRRCGWGGTQRGSAYPLQSGPTAITTLQLSRPFSWSGTHVASGLAAVTEILPGWVQVALPSSTWVAAPKTWERCVGWLQRGSISWNLPLSQFVFFQNEYVGYNQSGFIAGENSTCLITRLKSTRKGGCV